MRLDLDVMDITRWAARWVPRAALLLAGAGGGVVATTAVRPVPETVQMMPAPSQCDCGAIVARLDALDTAIEALRADIRAWRK